MIDGDGQWRWNRFERLLPYAILLRIVAVKISSHAPMQDFPRWTPTAHGQFRVHSAYRVRMGLPFKDWIFANLTNSGIFAREGAGWELLFGSLVWLLWIWRNERIFEPEKVHWEPILSHGKHLQQECRAVATAFRQPGVEPALPRDQIQWEKPPKGWCKLNTDGAVTYDLVGTKNLMVEVDSMEAIHVVQQVKEDDVGECGKGKRFERSTIGSGLAARCNCGLFQFIGRFGWVIPACLARVWVVRRGLSFRFAAV
ncbi:hypothetical protein V6N12_061010 [Hibiscus sabdariffa]|uniref:RNase H type-1 domain-containing protein n=1 Tax=Hibiscus sabdariffa TaxID=183260 RepID=A0ABR2DVS6_9ROSI